MKETGIDFWAPRRCCLAPIPHIYEAADLLNRASDAHLKSDKTSAERFIKQADIVELSVWTEKLWGTENENIHRYRSVENLPPLLERGKKILQRMPSTETRKKVLERDRYNCRYCGIPVIRQEIRERIRKHYPEALRWGRSNKSQHTAFQCLWLTYEHVVPHSRGGDNSYDNVIISCQACNCAKMNYTIEEIGLIDPRSKPFQKTIWDGLERFK